MELERIEEEINKNVPLIFSSLQTGLTFKSPFIKGGLEFSRLKPYVPGEDPVKNIDWKVSAKGKGIFVREYTTLQKLAIFIALDSSASMEFGTKDLMKYEYAGIIAGTLIKASLASQMNVGIGFSHEKKGMVDTIFPTMDPGIYRRALQLILRRKYEKKFRFKKLLESIIGLPNPNMVIIIISDFLDIGEGWEKLLLTASQKFNILLCLCVRDPVEEELPDLKSDIRLIDPETNDLVIANFRELREDYKKLVEEENKKIKEKIVKSGAVFKKILTTQPWAREIAQFIITGT